MRSRRNQDLDLGWLERLPDDFDEIMEMWMET